MAPQRAKSIGRPVTPASLNHLTPRPPPRVWSQLDRPHQHAIAQLVAELLRRAYRLPEPTEGSSHDDLEFAPDADHGPASGPAGLRVRASVVHGAGRAPCREHR